MKELVALIEEKVEWVQQAIKNAEEEEQKFLILHQPLCVQYYRGRRHALWNAETALRQIEVEAEKIIKGGEK